MRALAIAVRLLLRVPVIVVVGILTITGALAYGILEGMGRKPSRRRYKKVGSR